MKPTVFTLLAGTLLSSVIVAGTDVQAQVAPPAVNRAVTNAPAARPTMRTRADFLAQRLNLTAEQKAKVTPILDEESKKFTELRKKGDLTPEDRRAKYTAIREETNTKLKAVLTPEQWEKYYRPFQASTNRLPMRLTNAPPAAPAK